jgi:hypothetical protein
MRKTSAKIGAYQASLKSLPFGRDCRVTSDGAIRLRTPRGFEEMQVHCGPEHWSRAAAEALATRLAGPRAIRTLLLAPRVPTEIGCILASAGVNYVDLAGNCHLRRGEGYLVHVEGRRRALPRVAQGRGLGATSYQVLFALLARPALVSATVRELAREAAVAKTTAADVLARLRDDGLLGRTRSTSVLLRPGEMLSRWLTGYTDQLRPRLLIGRFRAKEMDPIALEARLEKTLVDQPSWAWGGGAAARRLTGHYRGESTVLHVEKPGLDLSRRLALVPDRAGPVSLLLSFGPLALAGAKPRTAHPLLVYTELLAEGGERAREAAADLQTSFLPQLS